MLSAFCILWFSLYKTIYIKFYIRIVKQKNRINDIKKGRIPKDTSQNSEIRKGIIWFPRKQQQRRPR